MYTSPIQDERGSIVTNLKRLRAEVNITQENFARFADVQNKTYRSAEWGKNVSYTTASKILTGMNKLRVEKGLPELSLADLGLAIV
jgi:DNA-binding XRE family transcriptional regulator